jgi:hypothetical protein
MGKIYWLLLVFALAACATPAPLSTPQPASTATISPTSTRLPAAPGRLTFVDFFAIT